MTQSYKIDPSTICFRCEKNPLLTPLVFNGTDPDTGNYWCSACDRRETARRIATFRSR